MSVKSGSTRRRVPQRRCVVCGERRPKRELVRLRIADEDGLVFDETGKGPGRGAYVCRSAECWRSGRLAARLGQALHVRIGEWALEELAARALVAGDDAPPATEGPNGEEHGGTTR